MRINLFSSNVTALTLHGEIQVPGDPVSAWREAGFTDDDYTGQGSGHIEMLSSIGGYRSRGQVHQILFSLTSHRHDEADSSSWYIRLNYVCPASEGRSIRNPPRRVLESTRKLELFLNSDAFGAAVSDLHFDADYRFEPDAVEPIIEVPLIKFNDDSLPFTNIRGVRLTKESGPNLEYTVVLDATRSGASHLNVSFHTSEPLSTRLPGNLLSQSDNILSKFITKKG